MKKWTIFEIEFLWKHQSLCFHYWDYLMNVWCTNWQSIIDLVEKLCYNNIFRSPNIIQSTKFLLCTVIDFSKRSVHFDCLPYNMYYMKGGLMYLIRNNLQNHTKISNSWLNDLTYKMDVFSKKINHCALWTHQLGASWMGGIHCCISRVSTCKYLGTILILRQQRDWVECSKQFKWNLYFYVSRQSGPFWALLKLL